MKLTQAQADALIRDLLSADLMSPEELAAREKELDEAFLEWAVDAHD